jgi:peptidoglycan L-alanyl-D-glutamate endopeptidase CwlK
MPEFSKKSLNILNQCEIDLIKLFKEVIKEYDCTIVCAYRGQADQEAAYNSGNSHAHWKQSPHNFMPSLAVDCIPWPSLWSNDAKMIELSMVVKQKAIDLGIEIIYGGDWGGFKDLPHYELRDWLRMI